MSIHPSLLISESSYVMIVVVSVLNVDVATVLVIVP